MSTLATAAGAVAPGSAIASEDALAEQAQARVLGTVACTPESGYSECRVFEYTGGAQTFTLPENASSKNISVQAWGGGGGGVGPGGSEQSNGGGGGYTAGHLDLVGTRSMTVIVGQGGVHGSNTAGSMTGSSVPTYGGGGRSSYDGSDGWAAASGGGCSAVRAAIPGNHSAENEIITAAGGGGSGDGTNGLIEQGGAGGGAAGEDGVCTDNGRGSGAGSCSLGAGKGATQERGGAAGSNATITLEHAMPGTQFSGGQGGCVAAEASGAGGVECGGGGGGGYFGGGGGGEDKAPYDAPGGGGSSHVDTGVVRDAVLTAGAGYSAGGTTAHGYRAGVGVGGSVVAGNSTADGGKGLVVVQYATAGFTVSKSVSRGGGGLRLLGIVLVIRSRFGIRGRLVTRLGIRFRSRMICRVCWMMLS